MSHEQDDYADSDGAGEPPRGRHDEHGSSDATDPAAAGAEQRDDDRDVSDAHGAVSATRDEVDSVDDAIEAEIVNDPPRRRLQSVLSSWSGELPHPADAERYEALSPGTLDRLITLNERRMTVVEREVDISERREETIRSAVDAESDVKRALADADKDALRRGQWLSWSISLISLGAVILGLTLGYPQALWGIVVPIVQAGVSLVRTVTQARQSEKETERTATQDAE